MNPRDSMLYPYQRAGADWLASRRAGLLADDMGLGKTITALRAAARVGARRVLVLAPSVVLLNWKREADTWLLEGVERAQVVRSGYDRIDPTARLVVVSHGLFWRPEMRARLLETSWDVLIVDESHEFRNAGNGGVPVKRTAALYGTDGSVGLVTRAGAVWLLSGTPMPNHAGELWTMLHACAPELIESEHTGYPLTYGGFLSRYCRTAPCPFKGRKVVGNKRGDELRNRLRGFVLRRRKSDHLDLPPVRYETTALEGDVSAAMRVVDELATGRFEDALVEAGGDADLALDILGRSSELADFRRLCGLTKAPLAAELFEDELRLGGLDSLVVFAHHRDVLSVLAERLEDFGVERIDGSVSPAARDAATRRFQDPKGPRVMLCNIRAGGVGVTLTRASTLAFVELSWVPGENAQAADRIHRIGQRAESVRVRFLSLANTVDEVIVASVRRKIQSIREVMG